MGNPNSYHLSSDQIHELLQPGQTLVNADRHLQDCSECRAALCRQAIETGRLSLMENVEPASRRPDCPDAVAWAGVLAGILPAGETRTYLQHAMQCDACAVTLKESSEALAMDVPGQEGEDDRFLSSLHISTGAGRRELAQRLAATQAGPPPAIRPAFFRWIPAFGAAAVAVLFVVWLYPTWQARRAETIIAGQFQKGRPFEFRLDNVPYGPVAVSRGAGTGEATRLPEFVHAAPGGWRADLLEGDVSGAIDRLEKLRQSGDSSAAVLSDLAAAYAIRGDQLRSNDDYTRALAFNRELLQQDAGHRSALFNRALLLERLSRREDMRAALEEFLRVETDPGWRSEAQALLAR